MSELIGEIKGWIRHQPTPSKLLMSAVTAVESMGATLRTLNVAHMSRVHPVCSYIRVLVMQDMKWVNGCSFCRWMLALDSREKKIYTEGSQRFRDLFCYLWKTPVEWRVAHIILGGEKYWIDIEEHRSLRDGQVRGSVKDAAKGWRLGCHSAANIAFLGRFLICGGIPENTVITCQTEFKIQLL